MLYGHTVSSKNCDPRLPVTVVPDCLPMINKPLLLSQFLTFMIETKAYEAMALILHVYRCKKAGSSLWACGNDRVRPTLEAGHVCTISFAELFAEHHRHFSTPVVALFPLPSNLLSIRNKLLPLNESMSRAQFACRQILCFCLRHGAASAIGTRPASM